MNAAAATSILKVESTTEEKFKLEYSYSNDRVNGCSTRFEVLFDAAYVVAKFLFTT